MIFCGLGINNTIMYDQVKKSWAKQSVALDVRHTHTFTHSPTHTNDHMEGTITFISRIQILQLLMPDAL